MKYIEKPTGLKKYPPLWDHFLIYLFLAGLDQGDSGSGELFEPWILFVANSYCFLNTLHSLKSFNASGQPLTSQ